MVGGCGKRKGQVLRPYAPDKLLKLILFFSVNTFGDAWHAWV
jgi:hypothetical protein